MKWNEKLVSIVILNCNSTASIPCALESVFLQDYPRLEIIISDDGSENFSVEEALQSALIGKTQNVERIQVFASAERTGMVANLCRALQEIKGDYYVYFGSDDVLNNSRVISTYIYTFSLFNWEPLLVCGQLEMYDESLSNIRSYAVCGEDKQILYSRDPRKLFDVLAYRCVIPSVATCYRRDYIERVGVDYSIYKHYEDYPTYLHMARKGITPVFVDMVMAKHAAGRIATGKGVDAMTAKEFYQDRKRMWKTELDPYRHLLSKDSRRKHRARRRMERCIYRESGLRTQSKTMRIHAPAVQIASSLFARLKALYMGNVLYISMLKASFLVCGLRIALHYVRVASAALFALLDGVAAACLLAAAVLLVKKVVQTAFRQLRVWIKPQAVRKVH